MMRLKRIIGIVILVLAFNSVSAKNEVPLDTTRILAIGNSFSEDALEAYMYGLSKAAGHVVIIGNLYIGGAPLDLHWKNAQENNASYDYRKIGADGMKNNRPKSTIAYALADEKWDYISMQQSSPKSGLYQTYIDPLPQLFNYVKSRAGNPKAKYVFHQTWAYATNSTHSGFVNYHNNQLEMYQAIVNASRKAFNLVPFDMIVPSGTAIQNARTTILGNNLTRDGYHLDLNIGRYIASCTWFEAIFKQSVIGNIFFPAKLTAKEVSIAQRAAHAAIKKPFKVSNIKID